MTTRYAVYFVPGDESALAQFGFSMLGRDALGRPRSQPVPKFPGHRALVQKARVYGFHGTLKAPFRVKDALRVRELNAACADIAQRHQPISLTGLQVCLYRGFCALAFPGDTEEAKRLGSLTHTEHRALSELAMDCVQSLESFRAPLTEAEIQRRKPGRLTARQQEMLNNYGYPYVQDEFSFHMTLSTRLGPENCGFVYWSEKLYKQQVFEAPQIDRIALCKQEGEATFERLAEFQLG